ARSTGAGAEVEFAAGRWSASGPAGGGLVLRKSRGAAGGAGLGFGGTLGGVGEGVCETCQSLRCDETNSPLLGVFGPPERELSPGVVPIAAGLSCGISFSGGGGMGVCVHGASTSATAIGVG